MAHTLDSDKTPLLRTVCQSRPASILSVLADADATPTQSTIHLPDNPSNLTLPAVPSQAQRVKSSGGKASAPRTYRGFPSEGAYLSALRAWVAEKQYFEHEQMMSGFYGHKNLEYYAHKPGGGVRSKGKEERRREGEAKRAAKAERGASEQPPQNQRGRDGEERIDDASEAQEGGRKTSRSRAKSLGGIFARRGRMG